MRVRLLFFASLRERIGQAQVTQPLPAAATAALIFAAVAERFPAAADLLPSCRVAVNGEFAPAKFSLRKGDEVAVLPPVAGG
ncbi:MAG: molybdopterin converting factor subunit 1 [Planctomycetota bacterium]